MRLRVTVVPMRTTWGASVFLQSSTLNVSVEDEFSARDKFSSGVLPGNSRTSGQTTCRLPGQPRLSAARNKSPTASHSTNDHAGIGFLGHKLVCATDHFLRTMTSCCWRSLTMLSRGKRRARGRWDRDRVAADDRAGIQHAVAADVAAIANDRAELPQARVDVVAVFDGDIALIDLTFERIVPAPRCALNPRMNRRRN